MKRLVYNLQAKNEHISLMDSTNRRQDKCNRVVLQGPIIEFKTLTKHGLQLGQL
jgi:hypothetical protein